MLRDTFGEEWYGRIVFEGRDHLDYVRIIDLRILCLLPPKHVLALWCSPESPTKKIALPPKDFKVENTSF
jgi:hypothetical protein